MNIYLAKQNSDMTEGRGPMVTIGFFTSEEEALKAVKGKGVMGVGDGEVYRATVFNSLEEVKKHGALVKEELVYGYRQDYLGRWGYGWADNRDAPKEDPDFKEYLRLKARFER